MSAASRITHIAALLSSMVLAMGPGCGTSETDAQGAAGAGPAKCTRAFVGDPSLPIEVEITYRGGDGEIHALPDGGIVPLVTPPQGGKVLFIGVRARNLSPCNVEMVGALRDPTTGKVTIDGRSGLTVTEQADGWLVSDNGAIANFANISACPNQWASIDVFDQPFSLIVTLTTKGPKKVGDDTTVEERRKETTLTVNPSCDGDVSGSQACTCICKAGYSLGQVCN